MAALRDVGAVGAAHEEKTGAEIYVDLLQRDDFAFTEPGIDAGREHASPALGDRVEDEWYPFGLEIEGLASRDLSLLHIASDGIWTVEPLGRASGVERGSDIGAQMVHAGGADFVLLVRKEVVHLPGRYLQGREPGQLRGEQVAAHGTLAPSERPRAPESVLQPPGQQLAEGGVGVLRCRLIQSLSDPVFANL
ncbi:MAG TPA: hypothetical protein VFG23_08495 [Polyangia bacterium]|nr:hypothetical protein [Polyangia bacterium]